MSSEKNEFIRGPKWRTRTRPVRRHRAAGITFAIIVLVGLAIMGGCIWLLEWSGAPTWVVVLPWLLPTVGAIGWTLVRPTAAQVTDDDDDSWFGYAIRWVMVGELEPRPAPTRAVVAVLFGAPVVWTVVISGVLTLVGLA